MYFRLLFVKITWLYYFLVFIGLPPFFLFIFQKKKYVFIRVGVHLSWDTDVLEIRTTYWFSCLPPCGWGPNSRGQFWQQVPLPEVPGQPIQFHCFWLRQGNASGFPFSDCVGCEVSIGSLRLKSHSGFASRSQVSFLRGSVLFVLIRETSKSMYVWVPVSES